MQSISSRIWIRFVVSISYDDNHYTTGTFLICIYWLGEDVLFYAYWYVRLQGGAECFQQMQAEWSEIFGKMVYGPLN